jgi:hypothetical protein
MFRPAQAADHNMPIIAARVNLLFKKFLKKFAVSREVNAVRISAKCYF